MSFLNQISQFISRITLSLRNPFGPITSRIRAFRTTNPLSRTINAVRQIRIRNPFRQILFPFKRLANQLKLPKGLSQNRFLQELRDSLPGGDTQQRGKSRARARRKHRSKGAATTTAAYTQIHLERLATGQRTVLHIGTSIGSSTAEVVLNHPSKEPAYLQFTQVNPQVYRAYITLTCLSPNTHIEIEGKEITDTIPILHDSQIQIDGQLYHCELFIWDHLSAVTPVKAVWRTVTGPVRRHNEDAIGIYQHPDAYLFAIADGVGGSEAGEIVSEFAIQYMLAVFHKNIDYDNLSWHDIFNQAIKNINAEVRNYARLAAFTSGTTLTAVVIKGWDAHIVHVGDSRLYHWRANQLRQITTDHVEIFGAIPDGSDNAEQAQRVHKVLSQAIGKNDTINPDILTLRLQPGDKLMLCTDGAINEITAEEIAEFLVSSPLVKLPEKLIQLADERYNNDNATIIALEVQANGDYEDDWQAEPSERVYVGYNPLWPLRLKPPQELKTDHNVRNRTTRLLIIGLALIITVLLGLSLLQANGNIEAMPPEQETPIVPITPTNSPAPTLSTGATGSSTQGREYLIQTLPDTQIDTAAQVQSL